MQKDGHDKIAPSETPSEEEQNFLKRYSLKKVTIPKEKLNDNITFTVWKENEDLKNWFNPDYKNPKSTSRKKERIEYRDLSRVLKTNKPWWLESRGVIRNLSGQRLVSLVEESENDNSGPKNKRLEAGVDKKFKKDESKSSIDVAEILSREMHLCIKQAGEMHLKQAKPILKSPAMTPINSENNFENQINAEENINVENNKSTNRLEHNELQDLDRNIDEEDAESKTPNSTNSEEMAWIQDRLDRVHALLMSLDDLRLHSGCEKCQGKNNTHQQRETYAGHDRSRHNDQYVAFNKGAANSRNPSPKRTPLTENVHSSFNTDLKVCTCDLELIDREMIDLCCFLQELTDRQGSGDKCQYKLIMCRLKEIRKYLCEFMKKVMNCSEDTLGRKSETLQKVQNLCDAVIEEPKCPQKEKPKRKCCGLSGGGSSTFNKNGCCACCRRKKKPECPPPNIPEECLPASWRADEETQTEQCTNMVFIPCFYYNPLTGECQFQDAKTSTADQKSKKVVDCETQIKQSLVEVCNELFIETVPARSNKPKPTEPVCCICQMPNNAHCCCCPLKDKNPIDSIEIGKKGSNKSVNELRENKKGRDKENSKDFKKSKGSRSEEDFMQAEISKSKSSDNRRQKDKFVIPQPGPRRTPREESNEKRTPTNSKERFNYRDEPRDTSRPLAEIVVESMHSMKEQQKQKQQQQYQPQQQRQQQQQQYQQPQQQRQQQQQPTYQRQEPIYSSDRNIRSSKPSKQEVTFKQDYPREQPCKNQLEDSSKEPFSDVSEELVKNMSIKSSDDPCKTSIKDPFEGPTKDQCKCSEKNQPVVEQCCTPANAPSKTSIKQSISFHNMQTPRSAFTRSSMCHGPIETIKANESQISVFSEASFSSDCGLREIKICTTISSRSLGGELSGYKFCQNCYGKGVPIVERNLAEIIQNCIKDQKRGDVFLKFTIAPNNLFHIQIATVDNVFLGCFYATEAATIEARTCNGFDGCITLSVTEPQNSPSQIERLVDHAFMVVQHERRNKS